MHGMGMSMDVEILARHKGGLLGIPFGDLVAWAKRPRSQTEKLSLLVGEADPADVIMAMNTFTQGTYCRRCGRPVERDGKAWRFQIIDGAPCNLEKGYDLFIPLQNGVFLRDNAVTWDELQILPRG